MNSDVMNKHDALNRVAQQYRDEGYQVTMAASKGALPIAIDHLRESVDLIAQRGDQWVAVEVKRRDQLHEINPMAIAIEQNLPKWTYDLVVYPPDGIDGIPLEDGEPDPDYVEALLIEARELLDSGKLRASFLMTWAAAESAMRTSARRENLEIGNGDPSFVLKTIYSNGVVSFDVYERFRRSLVDRNRLVHGLSVNDLAPDDIRFMIESARNLLCPATASSRA
jgi:REase_AHJR-like